MGLEQARSFCRFQIVAVGRRPALACGWSLLPGARRKKGAGPSLPWRGRWERQLGTGSRQISWQHRGHSEILQETLKKPETGLPPSVRGRQCRPGALGAGLGGGGWVGVGGGLTKGCLSTAFRPGCQDRVLGKMALCVLCILRM